MVWQQRSIPGLLFEVKDTNGDMVLRLRGGMMPTLRHAQLIAAAPELRAALVDLVQRVDTTPIEDGSNLDTQWAHALLARLETV